MSYVHGRDSWIVVMSGILTGPERAVVAPGGHFNFEIPRWKIAGNGRRPAVAITERTGWISRDTALVCMLRVMKTTLKFTLYSPYLHLALESN